jgi:environmental stress-induced protein Ves
MPPKTDSSIGTHIGHAMQIPGTWAGGTSSAIYAYPPDAIGTMANARVWVATAVIEHDSPFSYFAKRTRVHMPIHGNGIVLHFQNPEETVRLETFDQHRFDGARPLQVTLKDGPIVAFNLIVETDVIAQAQVLRLENTHIMPPISVVAQLENHTIVVRVIYAIRAVRLEIAGQPTILLQPDDAFVFHAHAITQTPTANMTLQSVAGIAEVVIATLIFRTG